MSYSKLGVSQQRCALLALALLLALLLPASALGENALGASDPWADLAEQPLLVRLPDEVAPEQAAAYLAALGLEALAPIPRIHVWRARPLPGQSVSLQTLRANLADAVLWVEQDGSVHALDMTPNDAYYASQQWNLPLIGLEQAWHWSQGGQVTIAILDSGIDLAHPDLQARLWVNPGEVPGNDQDDDGNGYLDDTYGWDYVGDDPWPQDEYGHGTHVAGIAGAHTDNGLGVAGVGWDVRLMAVRVLNASGNGAWSSVAEGLIYAADNGASIINLSLGGDLYTQTVADAVAYARSQGCLIVAAAGNHVGPIQYPARLEGVMAVAATGIADEPYPSWSSGPQMDVAAPGYEQIVGGVTLGVYSTYLGGTYGLMYGTSMATPHVSGLAALLWAYDPALTEAEISEIITGTARDVYDPGWDERTGWGRIDAQAALARLALPALEHRYRFPLIFRRTFP